MSELHVYVEVGCLRCMKAGLVGPEHTPDQHIWSECVEGEWDVVLDREITDSEIEHWARHSPAADLEGWVAEVERLGFVVVARRRIRRP